MALSSTFTQRVCVTWRSSSMLEIIPAMEPAGCLYLSPECPTARTLRAGPPGSRFQVLPDPFLGPEARKSVEEHRFPGPKNPSRGQHRCEHFTALRCAR